MQPFGLHEHGLRRLPNLSEHDWKKHMLSSICLVANLPLRQKFWRTFSANGCQENGQTGQKGGKITYVYMPVQTVKNIVFSPKTLV